MKKIDWSLSLEDAYYEENPAAILDESVNAVRETMTGRYVNLVTPGTYGDPREAFIAELEQRCKQEGVDFTEIRYIDECGCGGFVTRVYK